MTSSASAFTGPDDFVYKCTACQYVENDVSRLRYKFGASVILCCAICPALTEVMLIPRFEYLASQTAMASSPATETPMLFERTPSPLPLSSPMSEEDEAIDDDMSISAAAQAADNPFSTAASSKSEEILANVKNLLLYDDETTRVKVKAPYDVHVEFFDFDALPAVEPSPAVPHIRIGSEYEDPIYSRSVDPMDDLKY